MSNNDTLETPEASAATPTFADVQAILNRLVEGVNWDAMKSVHHAPNFGWDTVEQLQSVVVSPNGAAGPHYPLIDPELVRNKQGDQTNLVMALQSGVDIYPQMPLVPPARRHATDAEIQTIIDWLNAGMPS
ncbi:hypothetical protein ACXR0O_08260 [Verrucomicrobiota bacterium sgz303538]